MHEKKEQKISNVQEVECLHDVKKVADSCEYCIVIIKLFQFVSKLKFNYKKCRILYEKNVNNFLKI